MATDDKVFSNYSKGGNALNPTYLLQVEDEVFSFLIFDMHS